MNKFAKAVSTVNKQNSIATDNLLNTSISRRAFLQTGFMVVGTPLALGLSGCNATTDEVFAHGVASGDPLANKVIIWTRISFPQSLENLKNTSNLNIEVTWQVATTEDFSNIVHSATTLTSSAIDFTVKVDVDGLNSGTRYFYRFIVEDVMSPTGRTKTLPEGDVEQVSIAYTSCSHHAFGFFNVYRHIARQDDLDAVLHLGDYIYEYGRADFYNNAFLIRRQHEPAHEAISLNDYRQRHAQYKRDEDLQAMHAKHPFIAIWDDHEFCNDTWKGGAKNHNPEKGDGDWDTRTANARKAYFEWMPIRIHQTGNDKKIYREFIFGNLVNLNMLDTRFIGRDKPIKIFNGDENLEGRSLLGMEQESWLYDKLKDAQHKGIKWKILGQQVPMLEIRSFGMNSNPDAWDGYKANRNRLFDAIENNNIDNMVILTGDVHSSWAAELSRDPFDKNIYTPKTGKGALAVEFITPSVTSPNIPIVGIQQIVGDSGKLLKIENQHIKYVNLKNRGFVRLNITKEHIKAYWHHVAYVGYKNNITHIDKAFVVYDGKSQLIEIEIDQS